MTPTEEQLTGQKMMITARAAKVPHKQEEIAEYESESSIQKIII